jgi:hypothetical protein
LYVRLPEVLRPEQTSFRRRGPHVCLTRACLYGMLGRLRYSVQPTPIRSTGRLAGAAQVRPPQCHQAVRLGIRGLARQSLSDHSSKEQVHGSDKHFTHPVIIVTVPLLSPAGPPQPRRVVTLRLAESRSQLDLLKLPLIGAFLRARSGRNVCAGNASGRGRGRSDISGTPVPPE